MTAKAPATQATIRRAIAAAKQEGLYVLAIRPDGTVIVGPAPVPIAEVLPPPGADDEEQRLADRVKL